MLKIYSNYSTNIYHVSSSVTWYCNQSWHNLKWVYAIEGDRERRMHLSTFLQPKRGTEKAVNPASLNRRKWPCISNLDTESLVFFPLSLSIWNLLAPGKRTLNLCDSFGTHQMANTRRKNNSSDVNSAKALFRNDSLLWFQAITFL